MSRCSLPRNTAGKVVRRLFLAIAAADLASISERRTDRATHLCALRGDVPARDERPAGVDGHLHELAYASLIERRKRVLLEDLVPLAHVAHEAGVIVFAGLDALLARVLAVHHRLHARNRAQ